MPDVLLPIHAEFSDQPLQAACVALAEHGFIEEVAGRGTKRERWWRPVDVTNELNTADLRDDPEAWGAFAVFLHELVRQYFGRVTKVHQRGLGHRMAQRRQRRRPA